MHLQLGRKGDAGDGGRTSSWPLMLRRRWAEPGQLWRFSRRGGAVGSPDDSEMYEKLLEEAPSAGDDGRRAGDPTAPPSHRGGKPLWLGGAVA